MATKGFSPRTCGWFGFLLPTTSTDAHGFSGWLKLFGDAIEQLWHLGSPKPH